MCLINISISNHMNSYSKNLYLRNPWLNDFPVFEINFKINFWIIFLNFSTFKLNHRNSPMSVPSAIALGRTQILFLALKHQRIMRAMMLEGTNMTIMRVMVTVIVHKFIFWHLRACPELHTVRELRRPNILVLFLTTKLYVWLKQVLYYLFHLSTFVHHFSQWMMLKFQ